jgi:hypothetical protein
MILPVSSFGSTMPAATSDGRIGTGQTVTFNTFPTAGPITVTLTVTDSLGTIVTDTKNIVVKPAHLH